MCISDSRADGKKETLAKTPFSAQHIEPQGTQIALVGLQSRAHQNACLEIERREKIERVNRSLTAILPAVPVSISHSTTERRFLRELNEPPAKNSLAAPYSFSWANIDRFRVFTS